MLSHVLSLVVTLSLVVGVQGATEPPACTATGPNLGLQQSWVRQHYPAFARHRAPTPIAIGFIVDRECRILRHSAGFPDTLATSGRILLALFPDDRSESVAEGIGDAIPPLDHDDRSVKVVWKMVRGTGRGSTSTPPSNEELKPTALASVAAGSLRSPAALARRSLTPAR